MTASQNTKHPRTLPNSLREKADRLMHFIKTSSTNFKFAKNSDVSNNPTNDQQCALESHTSNQKDWGTSENLLSHFTTLDSIWYYGTQ